MQLEVANWRSSEMQGGHVSHNSLDSPSGGMFPAGPLNLIICGYWDLWGSRMESLVHTYQVPTVYDYSQILSRLGAYV